MCNELPDVGRMRHGEISINEAAVGYFYTTRTPLESVFHEKHVFPVGFRVLNFETLRNDNF